MVRKGLLSYLNWQDKKPARIVTPRIEQKKPEMTLLDRVAFKADSPPK